MPPPIIPKHQTTVTSGSTSTPDLNRTKAVKTLTSASSSLEQLTKPGKSNESKEPGYRRSTQSSALKEKKRPDSTQADGAAGTAKPVIRKRVTLHTGTKPAPHPSHEQTRQFPLHTRLETGLQRILTNILPQLHDCPDATLSDEQVHQFIGEPLSKEINDYSKQEKTTDPHDPDIEQQQTCHEVDGFIQLFRLYIKPLLTIRDKQQLIKTIQNYQANGQLPSQTVAASTKVPARLTPADEFAATAQAYGDYLEANPDKPHMTIAKWNNQQKAAAASQINTPEMVPSFIENKASSSPDLRPRDNEEEPPLRREHSTHNALDASQIRPEDTQFTVTHQPATTLATFDFSKFTSNASGNAPAKDRNPLEEPVVATTIGVPGTGLDAKRSIAIQTDPQREATPDQFWELMDKADSIVSHFGVILRTAKTEQDIDKSSAISEASLVDIKRKLALTLPGIEMQQLAESRILAATNKLKSAAAQAKVLLAGRAYRALPEPPKPVTTDVAAQTLTHDASRSTHLAAERLAAYINNDGTQTVNTIVQHGGPRSSGRAANATAIVQSTLAGISRIHGTVMAHPNTAPLITTAMTDSIKAIVDKAHQTLQRLSDIRPGRWSRFKDRVRHAFGRPRTSDIITAAKQDIVQLERFLAVPDSTLARSKNLLRSDIAIYLLPGKEAVTRNLREQLNNRAYQINDGIARKQNKSLYLDQLKQHVIAITQSCDQLDESLLDMSKQQETLQNTWNQLELSNQENTEVTTALSRLAQLNDLSNDRAWRQNYAAIRESYRELPAPFLAELKKALDSQLSIRKVFRGINKQLESLTRREFDWRISR